MEVVHHSSNNMVLGPPADGSLPDCKTIPATMIVEEGQQPIIATFWQLTADEVRILRNGGVIAMFVWGGGFPPMAMEVREAEHVGGS